MSVTIMDAILAINPDAKVSIKNDAENHVYDEITWHDGTTPISDIDIAAKKERFKLNTKTMSIKEKERQNIQKHRGSIR